MTHAEAVATMRDSNQSIAELTTEMRTLLDLAVAEPTSIQPEKFVETNRMVADALRVFVASFIACTTELEQIEQARKAAH